MIHDHNGNRSEIYLRISAPREADVDWICDVHIDGKILNKHISFYGIDPYQAFQLATKTAFAWIKAAENFKRGEITMIDNGSTDIE